MKKKNKSKKKSCRGIGILSIIILILMAIIVLILTDVISLDNKIIHDEYSGIKLDSSKNYVYKANYSYENKYKEYKISDDDKDSVMIEDKYGFDVKYNTGRQYLSDLSVPLININTIDATNVNKEIENLYKEYAEEFDRCANEENEIRCIQVLTYYTYNFDNILSVVIVSGIKETSPFVFNYLTYNFDLETGNLLSYEEVLEKLGYDKDKVTEKVEDALKDFLDTNYSDMAVSLDNCKYMVDNETKTDSCYNISNNLFEESISDKDISFFVNDKGNISILAIPYIDSIENGNVNHYLFEITK